MPKGNGEVPRKKKQRLHVIIPIPALSTNKLFSGKKVRSYFYKNFRKKVFAYLNKTYPVGCYNLKGNVTFYMKVYFSSPLSDLSNAIKGVEDVLSEWINNGFNDRQISKIILEKYLVNKGEERMEILMTKSRKNIDMRNKGGAKGKCKKK